ncbi:hypothetical protein MANES_08G138400v8 [Manihot esculenta]|uniref:Terpene synthase metal-binding domain-containing protein n=1 Tax=Manihot esculenta TaxID=3983 RepID=A0A2C9VG33_MANES|nr:hypothetical protein MANES_08G138400v8 [Manihot esculenta]
MAGQVVQMRSNKEQEISRPLANFPPTVWGCDFASIPSFNSRKDVNELRKISKEKAMEELRKMCDNAWKDVNEESMGPTVVPLPLITSIINLARGMHVVYQYDDAYTIATSLKDNVILMFVEPLPED